MNWVLLAFQVGLSGVLLVAATGKVIRAEEFRAALRHSQLPAALIPILGAGIPTLEFGLGIGLLLSTPRSLQVALGATVALLVAFTAWMIWVVVQQLHLQCGCFGTGSVEIGLYTITRNGFLLFIAIGALALARQARSPLSLSSSSPWLVHAGLSESMVS